MQIVSSGNFYMGLDDTKYCEFDIHLGRLNIQYSCPNPTQHGDDDRRQDEQTFDGLSGHPKSP